MDDYYLADKSRLLGKPKKTIADYVEQNGLLVPRRFETLSEARNSKLPVLCRSEHPQDYDGVSGLLSSPQLGDGLPDTNDEDELKGFLLGWDKFGWIINKYCKLLKCDESRFKEEISFSFWERIYGSNRMIVADNAIKERYHIITGYHAKNYTTNDEFNNMHISADNHPAYTIIDNGRIKNLLGKIPDTKKELYNLIDNYERIRHLRNFNNNNCAIMEFQTLNGVHYFLQYYYNRLFKESQFVLDRKKNADEKKPLFLRGSTLPEGQVFKITIAHPKNYNYDINCGEEGYFGRMELDDIYFEMMAKKYKISINRSIRLNWIESMRNFSTLQSSLFDAVQFGHLTRSQLLKPEITLIANRNNIMRKKEYDSFLDKKLKIKKPMSIDIYVISDGRNAYFKRI